MKITRRDNLTTYDVRAICVSNNYYTKGSCEEYDNLFDIVEKHNSSQNWTDEKLLEVAADIVKHSDISPTEYITFLEIVVFQLSGAVVRGYDIQE